MNYLTKAISKDASLSFIFGLIASFMCLAPAMADDTEIFVTEVSTPAKPNLIFLIDTSGSMDSRIDGYSTYDPNVTYDGECAPERIYFVDMPGNRPADPPPCLTIPTWVDEDKYRCQDHNPAISPLGHTTYSETYVQWDEANENWVLPAPGQESWYTECYFEDGDSGHTAGDGKPWVALGNKGPWSASKHGKPKNFWAQYRSHRWNLFSSNYLNYYASEGVINETDRLAAVKQVTQEIIDETDDVRIGLMRLSVNGEGGQVIYPATDVATARTEVPAVLAGLTANGATPIAEAIYEAHQYFTGGAVDYGLSSSPSSSVPASWTADKGGNKSYISPITDECQKNFLIVLSDGEPNNEDAALETKLNALPDWSSITGNADCFDSGTEDSCIDEIPAYLNAKDLSTTHDEMQYVDTYTVGLQIDHPLLSEMAEKGNGKYSIANNSDQLKEAFRDVIRDIRLKDASFVAPSVAVSGFNRLTHDSSIAYTVFRPDLGPRWPGNLKRYNLGVYDGEIQILDADGVPAINPYSKTFKETAKSEWTTGAADGHQVNQGGLASHLPADRLMYTLTGSDHTNILLRGDAAHVFHEDNALITKEMVGAATEAERTEVIRWARGVDVDGITPLASMGDPLHTKPLIFNMGAAGAAPNYRLYMTSNDGFLHSINYSSEDVTDLERWAYIPQDLLGRLTTLKNNASTTPLKSGGYGLDGKLSYLHVDPNGNDAIDSGEEFVLYFGQRRGGEKVFAIQDNHTTYVKHRFTLSHSLGGAVYGFLGQSWSKAVPGKIRLSGTDRPIVALGGGYDTNNDLVNPASSDGFGNFIYLNAYNGPWIRWYAKNVSWAHSFQPEMDFSFPSDMRLVDLNNDGYNDRLYAIDIMGQLWRFDFDNFSNTGYADFATGGIIADLGNRDDVDSPPRRFYDAPALALIRDAELGDHIAISVGSGHRANPLGTAGDYIEDEFYLVRDEYIHRAKKDSDGDANYDYVVDNDDDPDNITYRRLTDDDLLDVTNNLEPTKAELAAAKGWKISMAENEKVLAPSAIIDNKIFFTSYVPDTVEVTPCSVISSLGSGRVYVVDAVNGQPRLTKNQQRGVAQTLEDLQDTENSNAECNYRCTDTGGNIPPEAISVILPTSDDNPVAENCEGTDRAAAVVIGTETFNPYVCTAPTRTYWRSETIDPPAAEAQPLDNDPPSTGK